MSFGKGGGQTRTITSTQGMPAEYALPYFKYGLSEAKRLYESDGPNYYPGSTVVGFSPESQKALQMTRQRALAGSPLIGQAQDLTQRAMAGGLMPAESMRMIRQTAKGNFLGGSPGLSGAIERAMTPVQEQLQAQLATAGRYGSGYGGAAQAKALGDIAADISYSDYQRERQNQLAAQQALAGLETQGIERQLGAAAAAPGMAELDYLDAQRLAGVGAAREAQAQAELAADIERYQFEQGRPFEKLSNYLAAIYGGQLGTQTQTPMFYNPAASFLGGAMGGAQLGGMIPGLGAGYGALGGGILGLLGGR